jgi:hypothetical protein
VRLFLAMAAAVLLYAVVGWLVRVAVTAGTAPVARLKALNSSSGALRTLRVAVGFLCGFGALAAAAKVLALLAPAPALALPGVVAVLVGVTHLYWGLPFRGTPQFADDLFSLVGEEAGVIAAALLLVA